ncbi:cellulose biosynthesis protein BcsO [Pantoea sp. BAV 3049]|uniref:cellulose biosynthesis protein BcsO n=1 Tax=Pantoea sp. BAV 3049 TaxID=2654188 RepID=UPI00131CF5BF|nr:cellulose biosynthesis protein BcsO [Pantoea sp. BAV 3049]
MKSYDDLQRFKEKTQTNHIEFKDMSEQTRNSDSANWAIIKQLMDEGAESALGNGQSVHVTAPQPVAEDLFSLPSTPPVSQAAPAQPQSPQRPAQPANVAAFVAAKPAAQPGGSLLDSISASLKPTPVAEQPQPAAVVEQPPVANPLDTAPVQAATPLTAAQPAFVQAPPAAPAYQPAPAVAQPAAPQPASQALSASADLPRFKQLFSTGSEQQVTTLSKDILLQPLLERIASCR